VHSAQRGRDYRVTWREISKVVVVKGVVRCCQAEVIAHRGRRGAEIAELDGGEGCRVEVFKCRCKLL